MLRGSGGVGLKKWKTVSHPGPQITRYCVLVGVKQLSKEGHSQPVVSCCPPALLVVTVPPAPAGVNMSVFRDLVAVR